MEDALRSVLERGAIAKIANGFETILGGNRVGKLKSAYSHPEYIQRVSTSPFHLPFGPSRAEYLAHMLLYNAHSLGPWTRMRPDCEAKAS